MDSDHGDFIGQGEQHVYDAANASIRVSGDASDVTIDFSTSAGDDWTYELAAARGQALAVGDYEGAARAPFRGASQPGLEVSGDGHG